MISGGERVFSGSGTGDVTCDSFEEVPPATVEELPRGAMMENGVVDEKVSDVCKTVFLTMPW